MGQIEALLEMTRFYESAVRGKGLFQLDGEHEVWRRGQQAAHSDQQTRRADPPVAGNNNHAKFSII